MSADVNIQVKRPRKQISPLWRPCSLPKALVMTLWIASSPGTLSFGGSALLQWKMASYRVF